MRAGERGFNADKMLCVCVLPQGEAAESRDSGVAFCSSPGVYKGLCSFLICSFYLLFRITRMAQLENILRAHFNWWLGDSGSDRELQGRSRTSLPH